jgi:hypothetical protein
LAIGALAVGACASCGPALGCSEKAIGARSE